MSAPIDKTAKTAKTAFPDSYYFFKIYNFISFNFEKLLSENVVLTGTKIFIWVYNKYFGRVPLNDFLLYNEGRSLKLPYREIPC